MKICLLTERMRIGFGVDLVVSEQAQRLVALGFEVIVFVIHADIIQPPRDYKLIVISKIMRVDDYGAEGSAEYILARCQVTDVDLWILHTPPFYDWARYLNAPVIFIEYGAPPGHFFAPPISQQIDTMATNRLFKTYGNLLPCDAIMSISHSIHNWMPPKAQSSSTVIHLGCDHYGRVTPDEAQSFRAQLGISPDKCLILWVGRMQLEHDEQPYKGFQELLALIPLVRRHAENVEFVLVGRVSDKDRYKLEEQGIIVLANQTAEAMARTYAAADVLINLSRWEGFNLALLEAQYQGTPAVAYDLGPHPEIIRHGETGLLAKTRQDLFRSIIKLSSDPEFRKKLSEQAEIFARDFTWDRSVGELVEIMTACSSHDLSRAEIAILRQSDKEFQPAESSSQSAPKRLLTTRDLLKLDGRVFVSTAYVALLNADPDQAEIVRLLRTLHCGGGKRSVLLELAEMARTRGFKPKVAGLQPSLMRARFSRMARKMNDGLSGVSAPSHSVWLDIKDDAFVRHAFRALLGREGAQVDVEGWTARLQGGESRRNVLAVIHFSEEGRGRSVTDPDLRDVLFPNAASGGSTTVWKTSVEYVANFLLLGRPLPSSEWFLLDNEEFVRHAFRMLLGREAEQNAVDGWVGQLKDGRSRPAILAVLRFCDEGRARPLQDPRLRRILFAEALRRSPFITWILGARTSDDPESEDIHRQLRRIESRQRSLATNLQHFGAILDGTGHDVRMLGGIDARLSALEAGISALQAGLVASPASPPRPILSTPRPVSPVFPGRPQTSRLGEFHVALVVPGTIVDPTALSQLAAAAEASGSDIIFGDEYERRNKPPFLRQRIRGPFSHDTFLRAPDLGGVIAVHTYLLEQLGLPMSVALTGALILRLVARAHTISYLPVILCERTNAIVSAARSSMADVEAYLGQLHRRAVVVEDRLGAFDVRFPLAREWKAAILLFVPEEDDIALAAALIPAQTQAERYELLLVQTSLDLKAGSDPTVTVDGSTRRITFSSQTPYGNQVNRAAALTSADCNLIVVMDAGVSPTMPDWLERLAESALHAGIGAVAPKTLYPNGQIRHAGMAPGLGEPCGYVARFADTHDLDGHGQDFDLGRLNGMHDVFAVSRHCMVIRRSVFQQQGCFDDTLGPDAADIDFCCRLHDAGLSVLLDGRVVMVQPDQLPRWSRNLPSDEQAVLEAAYKHLLRGGDRYWIPSHHTAEGTATEPTRIQTIRLPPLEDR
jgi:glycosyltransferase involved in cell wall biosynthesis